MSFKCAVCGEEHDTMPMDVAFARPLAYFEVPEDEREQRIKINDDLCTIDDDLFMIRGFMPIPVHDSDEDFAFGLWVIVEQESYDRYLELWDVDGTDEAPFRGWLSAHIPGYPDTERLEADLYLGKPTERPLIRLRLSDHPLAQEQMQGITLARVHDILETVVPGVFDAD